MDYEAIKIHCGRNSALSKVIIDDFLMNYAAEREKLVPVMEGYLKKYKAVARTIEKSQINYLKSEYIVHRIFRKGGYLGKYLQNSLIKKLTIEKYEFLEFQYQHPWRYSFAVVKQNPSPSFFEMEDIVTGEEFLLYSPGMAHSKEENNSQLWFNLIAFNGKCWQTFGLIIPLNNFNLDDLFFFATELNPRIENEDMLLQEVENNPFPFFMLLTFSAMPVIASRGFESLNCYAADLVENFRTDKLSDQFDISWKDDIYRLQSKQEGEFPHFAIAYFDEVEKKLLRSAMTLEGFDTLTKDIRAAGYELGLEADIVVSNAMLMATEEILNKEIVLNPYEELFEPEETGEDEELEKLNHFIKLALPFLNNNQEPDIKKLAIEAGIDFETAESVWISVKGRINK